MSLSKLGVSLVLAGAAPDTGNLGVSALCLSILRAIVREAPSSEITVLDHGRGVRRYGPDNSGLENSVALCGASLTRRLYRAESYARIRLAARLGGLFNQTARRILAASAVLDISGGDSFTDMYGDYRFRTVCLPKYIALENKKDLILLPQTYGPFKSAKCRETAKDIIRGAAMAWARDERSFSTLLELLGASYQPKLHLSGVDVAFDLESEDPGNLLSDGVRTLVDREGLNNRPIGMNVSGLIYNDYLKAREQYSLKADYRVVIHSLLADLLDMTDAPILLVPHVIAPFGHFESDSEACVSARDALPKSYRSRIHIIPPKYSATQTKWIIERCQWFCGTRMHSTIAALSSGVPTTAIAYSIKTKGVFETCGMGEAVVDPRTKDTLICGAELREHFRNRDLWRQRLSNCLPSVKERARKQMARVLEVVSGNDGFN